jgi:hypothetical protein
MFKRFSVFAVMLILLSLFLTSCGGASGTVTNYSGATTITLPPELVGTFPKGVFKDTPKLEGFKTKDDIAKVKTHYSSEFSKNGWKESAGGTELEGATKSSEAQGGFGLYASKDNKAMYITGATGKSLEGFIPGVAADENLFIIVSGAI